MRNRTDAVVLYLATVRLSAMPETGQRWLNLALSLMEVAAAVEIYRRPDIPYAGEPARIVIRCAV